MGSTDSASLPPAFPEWMRARDPILAREDTNGLYQAFRARRLRARKPLGPVRDQLSAMLMPASVMLGCWMGIKMEVETLLPLLAIYAALMVLLLLFCRDSSKPASMLWVSTVFGNSPDDMKPMTDLWLTPTTGAEVAEAIYLEDREATLHEARTGAITYGILLPSYYILLISPPLGEIWRQIPSALLLLLLAVQYQLALAGPHGGRSARGAVAYVFAGWVKETANEKWPAREVYPIGYRDTFLTVLPLICTPRQAGLWAESPLARSAFGVSVVLVILNAFYAVVLRHLRSNDTPTDFALHATRANEIYEPFMRNRIEAAK